MTNDKKAEIYRLNWQGRAIEIRYEPHSFAGCAHLEIRARKDRPLPITETGYRSHFTPAAEIDHQGGPVAYVEAWLNALAETKAWQRTARQGLQLSLF